MSIKSITPRLMKRRVVFFADPSHLFLPKPISNFYLSFKLLALTFVARIIVQLDCVVASVVVQKNSNDKTRVG